MVGENEKKNLLSDLVRYTYFSILNTFEKNVCEERKKKNKKQNKKNIYPELDIGSYQSNFNFYPAHHYNQHIHPFLPQNVQIGRVENLLLLTNWTKFVVKYYQISVLQVILLIALIFFLQFYLHVETW